MAFRSSILQDKTNPHSNGHRQPTKSSLHTSTKVQRARHKPSSSYSVPHAFASKNSENVNTQEPARSGLKASKRCATRAQLSRPPKSGSHRRIKSQCKSSSRPLGIIGLFAYESHTGFAPGNPNKVNQDALIALPYFSESNSLFAVCDGHGFYGGEVSSYIRESFPKLLSQELISGSSERRALTLASQKVNSDLYKQPFDISLSGSTMVSVLIKGFKMWCANIGDSRAVLARLLKPPGPQNYKHWMAIALSRDHKASLPEEYSRIVQSGGRVEAYQDIDGSPIGPARVWLKEEKLPGLAMSRSLGDGVCKTVGVICDPEIVEYSFTPDDKFIVIASDGVFEFLTNEDVVKIVVKYWKDRNPEAAAEAIAKEARKKWIHLEQVIDDISCIVLFLNQ